MADENKNHSAPVDDGDDFGGEGKGRNLKVPIIILSVVAALVAIGSVGQLAGAGWFGYRQILYGVNKVYLLNMGPDDLTVSIDGRTAIEVDSEGARLADVMGGEVELTIKKADGTLVETRKLTTDKSDALVKLSDDGCLAISDIGAFYGRGGDDLKIVESIEEKTREKHLNTKNIIWPREVFPRSIPSSGGPVLWVELIGCALIEEPKFMRGYLDVRLGERLAAGRGDAGQKGAPESK